MPRGILRFLKKKILIRCLILTKEIKYALRCNNSINVLYLALNLQLPQLHFYQFCWLHHHFRLHFFPFDCLTFWNLQHLLQLTFYLFCRLHHHFRLHSFSFDCLTFWNLQHLLQLTSCRSCQRHHHFRLDIFPFDCLTFWNLQYLL